MIDTKLTQRSDQGCFDSRWSLRNVKQYGSLTDLRESGIFFDDLTNRHRQVIVEGAMIFGRTILQPLPLIF